MCSHLDQYKSVRFTPEHQLPIPAFKCTERALCIKRSIEKSMRSQNRVTLRPEEVLKRIGKAGEFWTKDLAVNELGGMQTSPGHQFTGPPLYKW